MNFDLVIKGGRVVDPAQSLDRVLDVGFANGKVAAISPSLPASQASNVVDATGMLVLPGLIDFHTHVYWGGTSLGVDATLISQRSGTTTFVDAGSAGAGNMAGFVAHVIQRTRPRILAYINVSFPGIFAFSKEVMVGECADLKLLNARECVRVAREFPDQIVGVKARVGFNAGGASGIAPLDIAIQIAEELDLPVMAHIDNPPPSRDEVLNRLRPGDILTHCFRPFPNAPIDGKGQLRESIKAAHARGILLDIGHGVGSFGFKSARAALNQNLYPDILSSDVHVLSQDGPAFDVLSIMGKFLALGMGLTDVVRAVTQTPARAMRRPDLGTLGVGAEGDATIVALENGQFEFVDASNEIIIGKQRFRCDQIVIGGHSWGADA